MNDSRSSHAVPLLDPVAAHFWRERPRDGSPWLNEEIAHRMESRLDWITTRPARWMSWSPLLGGLDAHRRLQARYPEAELLWGGDQVERARDVLASHGSTTPWRRWLGRLVGRAPDLSLASGSPSDVDMVWANMALHLYAEPDQPLRQWHEALKVGGFLMFSCLGPDTLRELRAVYDAAGWPPPMAPLTDMHDWGDMLVETGFAGPVMDMERLTLTYGSADRLIDDLRRWGRNLHVDRGPGLRARGFRESLCGRLETGLPRDAEGRLTVTIEIIYGHAVKPTPRVPVADTAAVSLDQMRQMLKRPPDGASQP